MVGAVISIGWGIIGFGFWALMVHLGRAERMKLYELIEKASAEGRPVPPELLSRLHRDRPGPEGDWRMGVVWLAVGAGLFIAGIINFKTYPGPHPQLFYGPYALFPIPLLVGVAFLLLAWFNKPGR
jgi:hypothetical protein